MKKYIPNTITSMNLLSGVLGVIFTFRGRFDIAFALMLAAAVFDFFDGLSARLLGAYSEMGKELDSLSDMVSFAVLPTCMLVCLMRACTFSESVWCYTPVVLAVAGGLRLARFNSNGREESGFEGLATPAAALICGSLCYFIVKHPDTFLSAWAADYIFIPVLALCLSALMVSRIPMFSLKFKKGESGTHVQKIAAFTLNVLIVVAMVAIMSLDWSLVVLLALLVYVLTNIVFALFKV